VDREVALDMIQIALTVRMESALTVRMESHLDRKHGPEFSYSADINPT